MNRLEFIARRQELRSLRVDIRDCAINPLKFLIRYVPTNGKVKDSHMAEMQRLLNDAERLWRALDFSDYISDEDSQKATKIFSGMRRMEMLFSTELKQRPEQQVEDI